MREQDSRVIELLTVVSTNEEVGAIGDADETGGPLWQTKRIDLGRPHYIDWLAVSIENGHPVDVRFSLRFIEQRAAQNAPSVCRLSKLRLRHSTNNDSIIGLQLAADALRELVAESSATGGKDCCERGCDFGESGGHNFASVLLVAANEAVEKLAPILLA